jgi:hypothetical protein
MPYPYVPSPGNGTHFGQVHEVAQAPQLHSTRDLSWSYMVFLLGSGPHNDAPFETVDPNLLHVGAGTFADPFPLDPPNNTFSPANSTFVPSTTLVVGLGPSGTSATVHQAYVEPTAPEYKYQCTICQRIFDRMSRLDNCYNLHANAKPHRCFGACGWFEWYVLPCLDGPFPCCVLVLNPFYYNLAQRGTGPKSSSTGISTGTHCALPGEFCSFCRKVTENIQRKDSYKAEYGSP